MKILMTGATGFIGNYVYKELIQANYQVYVISRKQTAIKNWFHADILNFEETTKVVEEVQAYILIHLAWDVTHGEFWNAANNEHYAEASTKLFDIFLKNGGKKIISTGTCAEYPPSDNPVKEDVEYDGNLTPYGLAKKSVYNYLKSVALTKNFEFTWLRIFGIYGQEEDERRLFPSIIKSIIKKEEFIIQNSDCYFDYVYVEDVARFIVDCINKKGLGAINIGTGKSLSTKDIYEILKNYVKTESFKVIETKSTPHLNSRIPNCTKLKENDFNFSLENGLVKIINNYRN